MRQTVAEVVSAMRADNGPRVCSLMVRTAQYQYIGQAYKGHALDNGAPCGPVATAVLKELKWAEPLAEALHAVARARVQLVDASCTPSTLCTSLLEKARAPATLTAIWRQRSVWLQPSHGHWLIAEVPDITPNWGLFLIAGEACKAIPGCQHPTP